MKKKAKKNSCLSRAKQIIQNFGGVVRTNTALQAGIHPRTIYQLRDSGELEQLSRGVYRLAGQPLVSNPDLTIVAARINKGVICLLSALAFHEITTQIPHRVSIALPKGTSTPRLDFPPIETYRFSDAAMKEGLEEHQIDGVSVKIFNLEKTLADCFKFRNKLGMDVVLEALKLYKIRKRNNLNALLFYAKICRVENIMMPYLEATI